MQETGQFLRQVSERQNGAGFVCNATKAPVANVGKPTKHRTIAARFDRDHPPSGACGEMACPLR
jgi:hypothetical protein